MGAPPPLCPPQLLVLHLQTHKHANTHALAGVHTQHSALIPVINQADSSIVNTNAFQCWFFSLQQLGALLIQTRCHHSWLLWLNVNFKSWHARPCKVLPLIDFVSPSILLIRALLFPAGVSGQNVQRANRGSHPRRWYARRRTLCTTCTVSPASCAADNWPPGTSFTSWRTAGWCAKWIMRRPNKTVGATLQAPGGETGYSDWNEVIAERCGFADG